MSALSLGFKLRNRASKYSPIPIFPRSFGQGLSIAKDLEQAGVVPQTIFDVGANVGQSAYEFSCLWPHARIHSFEPVSSTYQTLRRSTRNLKNVTCHHFALSDRTGTVGIHLHGESGLNSIETSGAGPTESIRTETLDHFAESRHVPQIDLLKIDVEGHELSVLRGSETYLSEARIGAILIEVGFLPGRHTSFESIARRLTEYGFVVTGFHDQRSDPSTHALRHANAIFVNPDLSS